MKLLAPWLAAICLAPVDDKGDAGGEGVGGAGDDKKPARSAEQLTVDQVHGHEDRLKKLEDLVPSFLRSKPKDPPPSAPGNEGDGKKSDKGAPPAPTPKKTAGQWLAEVADPFGMFDDEAPAEQQKKATA